MGLTLGMKVDQHGRLIAASATGASLKEIGEEEREDLAQE
jgi:hypothetical protein